MQTKSFDQAWRKLLHSVMLPTIIANCMKIKIVGFDECF